MRATIAIRSLAAALTAAVVLLAVGLSAVMLPASAQTFDRQAMVAGWLTETILPLHQDFAAEAADLEDAALAFAADPAEQTLEAFQSAWIDAVMAFERISVFSLQRVMPLLTQIGGTAVSIENIEDQIALREPGSIDADFVGALGSSSKGLPALEYLLFAGSLEGLQADRNRIDYAVAAAVDIRKVADALVVEWTPGTDGYYGDKFMSDTLEITSVRSMVSMVTNELFSAIQAIGSEHLGGPLGLSSGGEIQPELVESPYSGTSVRRMTANIGTVRRMFEGSDDMPGMADYLDFIGARLEDRPLSDVVMARIAAVETALSAITEPLSEALVHDPAAVKAAYEEVMALLQLAKSDVANQLGITITFGDSDGD